MGTDCAEDTYPRFGFFGQEIFPAGTTSVADWPVEAGGWAGDESPGIAALQLGSMPEETKGTADTVCMAGAPHNLA